ncbi:hypothetical protein NIES4071_45150 [Calothrix sp. NIES-4071]|nr:hypothetical protein NIES4071_45150 [Calothrix sp. NIES-4071]BAZ58828.1 hypothetical protein NIES4105_45080 [Calothrix sp. NIES-4105]
MRVINYFETRACAPAYSGWVLSGITICFFGAAINTMAGWLYVISGVSCALLFIAAVLPAKSIKSLSIRRRSIQPVTAGDDLVIEFEITNQSKQPVTMLSVEDVLPYALKKQSPHSNQHAINIIDTLDSYSLSYCINVQHRGLYRWHTVEFRSGAPFGLFWTKRARSSPAIAIVYPQVLPLKTCPLIDEIGLDSSCRGNPQGNPYVAATEGLVRSLRPYHVGDPIRLVHWRTSARYGELRVREFETIRSGQDIIIALDSKGEWDEENFEQAVIAAASLYFYATRQQMNVQLWTEYTGLVKGEHSVLETLAATTPLQDHVNSTKVLPKLPIIWLTQNPVTLSSITNGSRWLLWQPKSNRACEIVNQNTPGIILNQDEQLQLQLQRQITANYN